MLTTPAAGLSDADLRGLVERTVGVKEFQFVNGRTRSLSAIARCESFRETIDART